MDEVDKSTSGSQKEIVPILVEVGLDGTKPASPFRFTYSEPSVFATGATVDYWFRSESCCGAPVQSFFEITTVPVPEPATWVIWLAGLLTVGLVKGFRR